MSLNQMSDIGIEVVSEFPLQSNFLMLPSVVLTKCRAWNFILVVLAQLIPSLLIDLALSLKGEKKL